MLGGLQVLLKSWGADVIAFDSYGACAEWAGAAAAQKMIKPDLLIVDFRLESGHTGIEVIRAMRAAFGQALPAVIVTGSLMSNQEGEAQAHNFHLVAEAGRPHQVARDDRVQAGPTMIAMRAPFAGRAPGRPEEARGPRGGRSAVPGAGGARAMHLRGPCDGPPLGGPRSPRGTERRTTAREGLVRCTFAGHATGRP